MDIETTFDLLSSSVRRAIITVLRESNSITRERLTATLAGSDADDDSVAARRRIRIALHHNHLPKLAEAGLITYDDETVTATAELEQVAQAIPLPDEAGQASAASIR